MLWLYIHFPSLQLDHYQRAHTHPLPVALVDGQPPRVREANQEARQQGVSPEQSIHTAASLAPTLQLCPDDTALQEKLLSRLAQRCYHYAAHITLCPHNGLLLEVSTVLRLHGGLQPLYQQLAETFQKQAYQAWIACGATPLAARLLARNHTALSDNPSTQWATLRNLPIQATDMPVGITDRLSRMGLRKIGQIMDLPTQEIAKRLGTDVTSYIHRLSGRQPDPQPAWSPPKHFELHLDLLRELDTVTAILFPLQRLLQELADFLRQHQLATDTLHLNLEHRYDSTTHFRIRTGKQAHNTETFLQLCRLQLEHHILQAPVVRIQLRVDRWLARQPDATDLFGSTASQDCLQQALLDRLQARLGRKHIKRPNAVPDHRPEKAWQADKAPAKPPLPPSQWPQRPLWFLDRPQPLLEAPQDWLSGPERLGGGWWDGQNILRDYYVARLTTGRIAWVFRQPQGGWFIHGWFA